MGVMKIVNKNSSIKDNKLFKMLLITVSIIVLVVLSIFAVNLFNKYKDLDNAGEKCVEYLYSFNSLADLQENDEKLKKLSGELDLDFDNLEAALQLIRSALNAGIKASYFSCT